MIRKGVKSQPKYINHEQEQRRKQQAQLGTAMSAVARATRVVKETRVIIKGVNRELDLQRKQEAIYLQLEKALSGVARAQRELKRTIGALATPAELAPLYRQAQAIAQGLDALYYLLAPMVREQLRARHRDGRRAAPAALH